MNGPTEGPWHYDRNVGVIYGGSRRYARPEDVPSGYSVNEWNRVATVNDFFNYDTRERLNGRRDANARLISAAPDLLRAAEAAEVALEQANRVSNRLPNGWRGVRLALRGAIAKAKGEVVPS